MTLVLRGGPHDSCHFQWERFTPPEEIHLRGPDAHTTSVYELTGRAGGMWVYATCTVTWDTPPRLVRFVEYNNQP